MSETWSQWEGQTINGVLPLRRCLGESERSGVFLTKYRAGNRTDATVKLVRLDEATAEVQLTQWRALVALNHPHLVRVFEAGRCQLGEHPFLFVVMEHADQTLAQILRIRPLGVDEMRDVLAPVLDALTYLHRQQLVHGRLAPANVLSVGDQLKLSSDSIRPAGIEGTASDLWSLGLTLVEALTQQLPVSPQDAAIELPATLPPAFAGIVRRCLDRDPAQRPTAAELRSPLGVPPPVAPAPAQAPVPTPVSAPAPPPAPSTVPVRPCRTWGIAALLVVIVVAWIAFMHLHRPTQPAPQPAAAVAAAPVQSVGPFAPERTSSAAPPPAARMVESGAESAASAMPSVVRRPLPTVSVKALGTIHGRLHVTVRVRVDAAGKVFNESLEDPGPSQYFARKALEAARQWRFVATRDQPNRYWLLRFEFTRAGTTVSASSPWS